MDARAVRRRRIAGASRTDAVSRATSRRAGRVHILFAECGEIRALIARDFCDYLPFDTAGAADSAISALQTKRNRVQQAGCLALLAERAHDYRCEAWNVERDDAVIVTATVTRSFDLRLAKRTRSRCVGAISDGDAIRLIEAGVRPDRVIVTGDTRYDQAWQKLEARTGARESLIAPFAARASRSLRIDVAER
jgi:hypothetical protein